MACAPLKTQCVLSLSPLSELVAEASHLESKPAGSHSMINGESWEFLMSAMSYSALGLLLVVGLLLVEAKQMILAHPRMGVIVSILIVFLGFSLGRYSSFSPETQLIFSSGMMALGVSIMAAVIVSAPAPQRRRWLLPEWRPAAETRLRNLRHEIDNISNRRMPERHRELKLRELYDELMSVIEAMQRLEKTERQNAESDQ
jgi:hypothetical protein